MLGIVALTSLLTGPPVLLSMADLPEFPAAGAGKCCVWAPVDPGIAWDELVVSWNVKHSKGALIKFEARVLREEGATNWYTFGVWSADSSARRSIQGQRDDDGQVLTDTLRLNRPGGRLQLRAYMESLTQDQPQLELVTLSFCNRTWASEDLPFKEAWGREVTVPARSQMSYPNGDILCSPTSVSMLMAFWAHRLSRPELDRDVPDVESGAIDAGDPKTGNWPFSTAFAATVEPFVGYVSRLAAISDLERWIAQGIPVACSVDYTLLQGKSGPKSGHLVVLIGFTSTGDPIFNDPGWSKEVRQIYKRSDFERAWESSCRTVYLVYPKGIALPSGPGAWLLSPK